MPDSASARVPRLPLKEAKAAADQAGVPDYMAELSIFQVLLNHPTLARALNDLLATMLWHGKLDRRLRELVIMRIGWLTACDYEWTQHWRVACGLTATDEVVHDGAVGTPTWAACEREFGADPAVLIELVTAIGAWQMIASILHSLEVPLEEGVSSWLPDGRRPSR